MLRWDTDVGVLAHCRKSIFGPTFWQRSIVLLLLLVVVVVVIMNIIVIGHGQYLIT